MRLPVALLAVITLTLHATSHASTCAAPIQAANVAVPGHPFAAAATADHCWLFVSLDKDKGGGIAVLHNQDGNFALQNTVALAHAGYGTLLSHDGRVLLVTAGDDTLALDVAALEHGDANAMLGKLPDGPDAGAVYAAISPDDRLLFVSDEDGHRIDVFDLAKARAGHFQNVAPDRRIAVATAPVGLAFSPDGRWLYATSQNAGANSGLASTCEPEQDKGRMHPQGLLYRIDVGQATTNDGHAIAAALPAGCNPVRVTLSPDGKQIWVTARGDDTLQRIQADEWLTSPKHARIERFAIGNAPVGVTIRPDGKQVWVALSNRFGKDSAGRVAGLADASTASPTRLLSAPAVGFPREVSFLPDGRTLVATLFDARQVALIPTPD
jgi:DNA-binding beta-propeller fold protein YncE